VLPICDIVAHPNLYIESKVVVSEKKKVRIGRDTKEREKVV